MEILKVDENLDKMRNILVPKKFKFNLIFNFMKNTRGNILEKLFLLNRSLEIKVQLLKRFTNTRRCRRRLFRIR